MKQILRNTPATLSATFFDEDGAVVDPGVVTVDIARADGTALVEGAATVGSGMNPRTFALASQANLDILTATWSGTVSGQAAKVTTRHEIVGAFLFSIAQARTHDLGLPANEYPADTIRSHRTAITDLLETYTNVSWVPRFARKTFVGKRTISLLLPDLGATKLLKVEIDGEDKTAGAVLSELGEVILTHGTFAEPDNRGDFNVAISYERGHETLVDGVDDIALTWLRDRVVPSNIQNKATSFNDETGRYQLAFPSSRNPSGIPEVDAWIALHRKLILF